jgi:hypothetical protein
VALDVALRLAEEGSVAQPIGGVTRPQNKGMKQTKPAQAMELRSLSPVFDGLLAAQRTDSATESGGRWAVGKLSLIPSSSLARDWRPSGQCLS